MKKSLSPKIFFAILLILMNIGGCSSDPQPDSKATKANEKAATPISNKPLPVIRIAINSTIKSSSIIIAQEKGFFKEQGLDIKLLVKKTGVATHQAVDDGEAELATIPEILAAYDTLKHADCQIITSTNRSNTNFLIARKDRGIGSIADLEGKKIGLKLKSGSIYWLSRLLTYNSLFKDDVTLVDGQPGALVKMIQNGATDAVITWHPHAYKIQKALGENAISFAAQQNQDMYWVLIARRNWLSQNPDLTIAILKGLRLSAQYITDNEQDAKNIISQFLNLKRDYVDFEWPLHRFVNELPQNMLQAMEEEVQWKLGQQKEAQLKPDLSNSIYSDALLVVNPDAVGIIR